MRACPLDAARLTALSEMLLCATSIEIGGRQPSVAEPLAQIPELPYAIADCTSADPLRREPRLVADGESCQRTLHPRSQRSGSHRTPPDDLIANKALRSRRPRSGPPWRGSAGRCPSRAPRRDERNVSDAAQTTTWRPLRTSTPERYARASARAQAGEKCFADGAGQAWETCIGEIAHASPAVGEHSHLANLGTACADSAPSCFGDSAGIAVVALPDSGASANVANSLYDYLSSGARLAGRKRVPHFSGGAPPPSAKRASGGWLPSRGCGHPAVGAHKGLKLGGCGGREEPACTARPRTLSMATCPRRAELTADAARVCEDAATGRPRCRTPSS